MSTFSTTLKRQTLAEQVADTLKEAILASRWQAGEALPTEPELCEQFDVSRAVVRDATRMLVAQGLVDAQHGRGVFVTGSPVEAFGDALLLALRRMNATAWDVERFEQMVIPEICAEASVQATDEELATIRALAGDYHAVFAEVTHRHWEGDTPLTVGEHGRFMSTYHRLMQAIFNATHNRLWQLLAQPLLRLRESRHWESSMTAEEAIAYETGRINLRIEAIASRDPVHARQTVATLMHLPPEAISAMQQTPVGETPYIPRPLPHSF
jgi:DNA-binding FadR family transcriptional regulator